MSPTSPTYPGYGTTTTFGGVNTGVNTGVTGVNTDVRFEISIDDTDADSQDTTTDNQSVAGSAPRLSPTRPGCLFPPSEECNGIPEISDNSDTNNPPKSRVTFFNASPAQSPSDPIPPQNRLRVDFIGMEDIEKNKKEVENDIKRLTRGKGINRLQQPRMSLLGKPLNYRAHKRDARYRRTQARVYNFLERPKDWRSISYHLLV